MEDMWYIISAVPVIVGFRDKFDRKQDAHRGSIWQYGVLCG